ncbi:MAG: FAD-dependent oxidoreductase [Desulfobacteraceae bacterium]|nr:MAG: FAD-dependent oxidoreductase [Desulfobacteraceae bacterium]
MGYKEITLQMPPGFQPDELKHMIEKTLGIREFSYQIESKSLDARKKSHIHWLVKVGVVSEHIQGPEPEPAPELIIPYQKRNKRVIVVGSGPAGFFSAYVLQKAGFETTIIERGTDVARRADGIKRFESTGAFSPNSNYAFGEGGAGTFSDGKLTSRTKRISLEKQFILASYIKAGAPEEIRYLAHPHLGSNILKKIVVNLRKEYLQIGGSILFETQLQNLTVKNARTINTVTDAVTLTGTEPGDYFLVAPGNSAHDTARMLIQKGVVFQAKSFAIGCRVEHPQELINRAQWGREEIPGVAAAEYRLTFRDPATLPVYTFCMCPGGVIVPATAFPNANIVNGMSHYRRDGKFANAACVAAVNPDQLIGKKAGPLQILGWLGTLEEKFYRFSEGFQAPACSIRDFIAKTEPAVAFESSYPLGLKPARLWELLPTDISHAIREGLKNFSRKIRGFETGIIMGLESKTSSPIQALRDENRLCPGFDNLYIVGEGSGHSGGIISSGVDGIRAALKIIEKSN